ncbi:MAG: hypothetical protein M3315_14940, partial [Actinomycetota bacterium]|nr:hypothetical protein [Actinomycetota bacterium]
ITTLPPPATGTMMANAGSWRERWDLASRESGSRGSATDPSTQQGRPVWQGPARRDRYVCGRKRP